MDIFLTRELETWIRDCLRAGTYRSEGELVRHALRLLRERHGEPTKRSTDDTEPRDRRN